MKNIYIVAHTWDGISLEIDIYYTPEKAVKAISEIVSDEWGTKANPDDDPKEYLGEYYDWVRAENDNQCDCDVALEIIQLS